MTQAVTISLATAQRTADIFFAAPRPGRAANIQREEGKWAALIKKLGLVIN